GTHLYNTLGLEPEKFQRIDFRDEYFQKEETLDAFVKQCDVIVHLAAMNRHNDPGVLYRTNIELVQRLIDSMERTEARPYVIMSSSLQEERDNLYGRSKREGRELFNKWADRNDAAFTGLIIPNVFGPFGVPFYNSVISTFSHQVVNNLVPKIEVDAELKLIYVGDLVRKIIGLFPADNADMGADFADLNSHTDFTDGTDQRGLGFATTENTENTATTESTEDTEVGEKGNSQFSILNSRLNLPRQIQVEHMAEFKVSELLEKLQGFREMYQLKGIFPELNDRFELALFNTFRSYLPNEHFPVKYMKHADPRGVYVEAMKFCSGGQAAFSTTVPGITRGNHFHTRKVERFAVIQGKASIKLRKYGTDEVIEYILDGNDPAYVDMPIWYTHNITNIGDGELLTMFWINEFYDPGDPDTFFEKV
ncbi:MAG: NAD-dependent epimerase/dehydratase family protein, partial [Candidatus Cloacimonetes bacterium]|nr:NAD-dependent epimerase/dehydratase family protein [Candidatus Cloacimonadota bacterium]MDY0171700.1 NAD-dependent epimerase/dehydratase family protein [Candidatus Cloacimonadaceae bacterium]